MQQITPNELKQLLENGEPLTLLDVRESWEFELCRIDNSLHLPLSELIQLQSLERLDPNQQIIAICHHGIRSQQAALILQRNGFDNVCNLIGGIHHWSIDIDPSIPRY